MPLEKLETQVSPNERRRQRQLYAVAVTSGALTVSRQIWALIQGPGFLGVDSESLIWQHLIMQGNGNAVSILKALRKLRRAR